MTLTRVSIAAFAAFFAACLCAQAQDATPLPEPAATPEPANAADTRVLTPEEKAEKEARDKKSARRRRCLRHRQDLARGGHCQDARRPNPMALGQGGLPIEA